MYAFQGQSEGEFKEIQLTPDWEPFKYTGSSVYISGNIESPNGAIHGIAMCKNNDCSENKLYYWNSSNKGYYTEGVSEPLEIVRLTEKEKNENPSVTLFWNYEICGYNKTYTTTWNYIKDKKGFDLTEVTDENVIKYKETIPCVDGSGSTVNPNDSCEGKDIAEINKGYNNVLNIIDSNDKVLIVETIKNVEDCSLGLLSYTQIEKLIKKLGYDSTIKDDQESAIIRLSASIKTEDFIKYYALLEQDNNKLIKNLISHLQDKIVVYGGNNYTGLMSVLVSMYNKYPKSITDRWPTNDDDFATRIINLNPVDYSSDTNSIFYQKYTSKYNEGKYNENTGNVNLYDVYKTYHYGNVNANNDGRHETIQREELAEVSPLTPIVIIPEKEKIPLIEAAIEGYDFGNEAYIVPAVFLKYNDDKNRNDKIEKSSLIALDAITIYASGGTALATKVHWIRRAWALAEVAGAVSNIAVNTTEVSPQMKEVVETYNLAMGIIGLKNVGVGTYKFVKTIPSATKTLLKQNKGLRDLLTAKYLEWKTLTTKLDNLSDAERKLINEQEKVWRSLGIWGTILDDMPNNFFENVNDIAATFDKYNKVSSTLRGEIYNYYKQKNWVKLEQLIRDNKLNGGWPPANGGYNILDDVALVKGMKFDRYGDALRGWDEKSIPLFGGEFTSPIIDSKPFNFGQRALNKAENNYSFYYEIEVLKDLPFTGESSDVIPWFNQVGNGKQMRWKLPTDPSTGYPKTWNKLAEEGYIRIIIKDSPSGKYKQFINRKIGK